MKKYYYNCISIDLSDIICTFVLDLLSYITYYWSADQYGGYGEVLVYLGGFLLQNELKLFH